MQGLMQGFWLAATAVGNSLLFVGGLLYTSMPMWITWGVFVIACGGSMLVMLSMVQPNLIGLAGLLYIGSIS